MHEERTYRNMFKGINLKFFDVCAHETDLRIGAHKDLHRQALSSVAKYRDQLEAYIKLYPEFAASLKPVEAQSGAPVIVSKMCKASKKVGVGPMAAVAGAMSEMVGLDLLEFSDEIVIENGGDIFLKTDEVRKAGIYAGKSPLSEKLALEITPKKTPLGICTSSGTVGHSLSLGKADAAVILSKDTFLADAAATAVCNMVKSSYDIERAVDFASGIDGVQGALIIMDGKIGAWGDIKLVKF